MSEVLRKIGMGPKCVWREPQGIRLVIRLPLFLFQCLVP